MTVNIALQAMRALAVHAGMVLNLGVTAIEPGIGDLVGLVLVATATLAPEDAVLVCGNPKLAAWVAFTAIQALLRTAIKPSELEIAQSNTPHPET